MKNLLTLAYHSYKAKINILNLNLYCNQQYSNASFL
ncbi:hypothetical protein CLOLEP_03681 [[Clostridium] leptum DSM 753]|uniref:Uncharacterized protein n=1 Tax=[Clostridium] leptum DSM 753 TaxID=428125 RepID=A7VYK2_9FIRM|nr:hypothetical protein CLOLEP_03681 [[Clostridium] leptum DSM 753]